MVQQVADRVREEEDAKVRKEHEHRCKNVKKKCLDKQCQEKADKRILPKLEKFEKELDNITMVKEHRRGEDLLLCGSDEDCKGKVNTEWEKFLAEKNCTATNLKEVKEGVEIFPGQCRTNNPFGFMKRLKKDNKCEGLKEDKLDTWGFIWVYKANKCLDKWCLSSVLANCDYHCGSVSNMQYNEFNHMPSMKMSMMISSMGKGQDQSKDEGYEVPEKRTETKEESLAPSLLSHIKDGQHKERDLEEAFCRDIDSFNLAFKAPEEVWRPGAKCKAIPAGMCGVVYDSHDCYAGWSLDIPDGGQINLSWSQSNDIDTVGVKAGCTLTGFSEDGYTGDSISISAGITERWVVLSKSKNKQMRDMDENIESIQCICR